MFTKEAPFHHYSSLLVLDIKENEYHTGSVALLAMITPEMKIFAVDMKLHPLPRSYEKSSRNDMVLSFRLITFCDTIRIWKKLATERCRKLEPNEPATEREEG